jgi:hypothetical protein
MVLMAPDRRWCFRSFPTSQASHEASRKVGDAARVDLSAELNRMGIYDQIPNQCLWEIVDEESVG